MFYEPKKKKNTIIKQNQKRALDHACSVHLASGGPNPLVVLTKS